MPEHPYPVPVNPPPPPARREHSLAAGVARAVVPTATESTRALVATLAVEQALARAVTMALGRFGRAVAATPFSIIVPDRGAPEQRLIVMITETTIIERITRRQ